MDRVDQALALPDFLEQPRGHAAADDVVEQEQGVTLGRHVAEPGEAHDQVHLLELLVDDVDPGLQRRRRVGGVDRLTGEAVEAGAEELDRPLVGHVPGHRDDDPGRRVGLHEVAVDGVAPIFLHGLPGPQDGPAERVTFPDLRGEEVMDQVVGRVLHHLDLLEHNRLFALELLGVEDRVQEDVGQEIDRERQVLVEHLDVEAGVLFGGERVHLTADGVHGTGDRLGAARRGPLEHEVLDQVGHPAAVFGLVARPGLDPHADGDRAYVLHALGDDPNAVRQEALPVAFRHALTSQARGGFAAIGFLSFSLSARAG